MSRFPPPPPPPREPDFHVPHEPFGAAEWALLIVLGGTLLAALLLFAGALLVTH